MATQAREPCCGQKIYRLWMAAWITLLLFGLLLLAQGLITGAPACAAITAL